LNDTINESTISLSSQTEEIIADRTLLA